MPTEVLRLGVDPRDAIAGLDRFSSSTRKATASASTLDKSLGGLGATFKSAAQLASLFGASIGALQLARQARDAVGLAARYETLGIVMETVGRNAGYTAAQMSDFQRALQDTGIAMVESRQNLTRLVQANIDLAEATDLARIAQDAAVIGNVNSSEAFTRLVHGIQSAQTEILRGIGLNVNFERSYADLASQLGRTVDSLDEVEKTQARVNVVKQAGVLIEGTYEAAMQTAGKEAGSLTRHFDNMKTKLGQIGLPVFRDLVREATNELKAMNEQLDQMEREGKLELWGERAAAGMIAVIRTLNVAKELIENVAQESLDLFGAIGRALVGDYQGAMQYLRDLLRQAEEFGDAMDEAGDAYTRFWNELTRGPRPGGVAELMFPGGIDRAGGGGVPTGGTGTGDADQLKRNRDAVAAIRLQVAEQERLLAATKQSASVADEMNRRIAEEIALRTALEDVTGSAREEIEQLLETYNRLVRETDAAAEAQERLKEAQQASRERAQAISDLEQQVTQMRALVGAASEGEEALERVQRSQAAWAAVAALGADATAEQKRAVFELARELFDLEQQFDDLTDGTDGSTAAADKWKNAWITAVSAVGNAVGGLTQDFAGIASAMIAGGPVGGALAIGGTALNAMFGRHNEIDQAILQWDRALDRFIGTLTDESRLSPLERDIEALFLERLDIIAAKRIGGEALRKAIVDPLIAILETEGLSAALEASRWLGDDFIQLADSLERVRAEAEKTAAAEAALAHERALAAQQAEFERRLGVLGSFEDAVKAANLQLLGDDRGLLQFNLGKQIAAQLEPFRELVEFGLISQEAFDAFESTLWDIANGSLAAFDAAAEAAAQAAEAARIGFQNALELDILNLSGDERGAGLRSADIEALNAIAQAIDLGIEGFNSGLLQFARDFGLEKLSEFLATGGVVDPTGTLIDILTRRDLRVSALAELDGLPPEAVSAAARGSRNDSVTTSVENISRAEAATLSTIARTQLVVLQQIEVNTRTIGNPSRQLAAENTTQQIAAGNGRL